MAVAISVWSGGALSGAAWAGINASQWTIGAKLAFAAASGAAAGGIQSGTVEGAAWGAFSAGVFFGIGQAIQGADSLHNITATSRTLSGAGWAVKTVSHGLAGGTISHLQGGKFGHGFVSAAGSAATAPLVDASSANVVRGAVVTTLVGGTLSRISGGNFANGALTAAMSYAFNQLAHELSKNYGPDKPHYHQYEGEWAVCTTSQEWCTLQRGFESLKHFLGSTCKCNTLTSVGWMHGDQDEALPAPVG